MIEKILAVMLSIVLGIITQSAVAHSCANEFRVNVNVTSTAPNTRYTDNGDGTVTDHQTKLMWKQCSEGLSTVITACDTGVASTHTWQAALQKAQDVNIIGFANYSDWRLPNVKELISLIEWQCYNPSINTTFFPNKTIAWDYWSSSPTDPLFVGTNSSWNVGFRNGGTGRVDRASPLLVRLVRGG